jgi:hypothetical protein
MGNEGKNFESAKTFSPKQLPLLKLISEVNATTKYAGFKKHFFSEETSAF